MLDFCTEWVYSNYRNKKTTKHNVKIDFGYFDNIK